MEFISLNKDVFKELCSEDINDHIRNLKHLTTWGTHVEIKAASYLLNIPIYVCTQKDGNDEFYWEVFKPNCTRILKFPESKLVKPAGVWHYELCHSMRCHYDIVVLEDGSIPTDPPPLPSPNTVYIELEA